MSRKPAHPLAEHPLDNLSGHFKCSVPASHRAFLHTLMLEASLKQCGAYVKGITLDVGCGRKPYEKTFFAGAGKYVGMDYLTDRSQPDVVGSALEIPFPDASFDTVVSTEVLEHVPDPLRAMKEMQRVLKPGGFLVLSTPMYWPRHEVPYDYFRYPYDGLLHLINTSGFELVQLFNRWHVGDSSATPSPANAALSPAAKSRRCSELDVPLEPRGNRLFLFSGFG